MTAIPILVGTKFDDFVGLPPDLQWTIVTQIGWPISLPTSEKEPFVKSVLREKASKKVADAKLAKDFQAVLKEFQKAQRLAAERETSYASSVPKAVLPSRFLSKLKSYCRNKHYPEGSIAEGYLAEECMTFCSRYLEDVETRLNRPSRNAGLNDHNLAETYLSQSYGEPIGKVEIAKLDDISWIQAHRYVLFHHDSIELLRNEYKQILRSCARSQRLQHREINKLFIESFHEWLSQKVWSGKDVNDEVKWLSQGPNRVIKRHSVFLINGYRFHTKYRERMRRTQNCRIVVNSSITSYASARDSNPVEGNVEYYGLLTEIIELDYYGRWKVVLFRCDWVDVNTTRGIKKDQFGFTMVNFSRLIHTGQQLMDEPYVFSSQVKQVFYSKDPTDEGWHVVLRNTPRDLFDMEKTNSEKQTVVGSSNVPETLDEPAEFQTESGGTHRGRGRTLLKDLHELNPVERVKDRERVGTSSRQKQKFTHTAGSRSFASVVEAEEVSSDQKVGRLQLFEITHKKKDGSPMTSEAGEFMEKLKENKAEYEAISSTDSLVNLENIDNRIITEVWVLKAQAEVHRLRDQIAQMQASTVEQIAKVQRKYEELQQQLRTEVVEREAAVAAREAEVAAMAVEQSRAESTMSSSYNFSK
ncbi:hypothetical protein PVK06_042962 [Gossypium arboreum]|uniref:DUF4216 domain-containing protein n=1 Tax=Gossypium arboreum TaxID=29729 RepID=A0ABR0MMM1_GOSAR|nr:hypothetical protein PVK06_042962 [Gossypium arboreum]